MCVAIVPQIVWGEKGNVCGTLWMSLKGRWQQKNNIEKIKVFRFNSELHTCPTILVVIAIIKSQILPVAV